MRGLKFLNSSKEISVRDLARAKTQMYSIASKLPTFHIAYCDSPMLTIRPKKVIESVKQDFKKILELESREGKSQYAILLDSKQQINFSK